MKLILKKQNRKQIWHGIVTTLAAIVVFVTTYALIIPAITWEKTLICELEEHVHTDDCYNSNGQLKCGKEEHKHTDACFDAPKAIEKRYLCGKTEHTHTEDCYFSDGTLKCTLAEHTHCDGCRGESVPHKVSDMIPALSPENISIVYHDQHGRVIKRDSYTESYTFHKDYPVFDAGIQYQNSAWNTKADGSGTNYEDGTELLQQPDADLNVYPVLVSGNFVRFESNGGSPVSSQFIQAGGQATEPAAPTRAGYSFGGWYTDNGTFSNGYNFAATVSAETTLYAKWTATTTTYKVCLWLQQPDGSYKYSLSFVKSATSGTNAEFTQDDQNLAVVKTATYSGTSPNNFPIYFCDDKYGETALTMTNASIAAVNDNGGIAGDGTSIINVYFRRFIYNVTLDNGNGVLPVTGGNCSYKFYARSSETFESAAARSNITINADLLARLHRNAENSPNMTTFQFNGGSAGFDNAIFNVREPVYFYNSYYHVGTDGEDLHITFVETNRGNNVFTRMTFDESVDSAMNHLETNYAEYEYEHFNSPKTTIYYLSGTSTGASFTNKEGFTAYFTQIIKNNGDVQNTYVGAYQGSMQYPSNPWRIEQFFLRNSYVVDFITEPASISPNSITMVYEQPLSDLNGKITYSDDAGAHEFVVDETEYTDDQLKIWVFKGWYDNDVFAGDPVDFATTTATMPANNLILYAKWELKKIEITYDPSSGAMPGKETGETVTESGDIGSIPAYYEPEAPEGMAFVCWTIDGQYYDFTDPIVTDTTLEAVYSSSEGCRVVYSVGDGYGTAPVDSEIYAAGSSAKVLAPTADMSALFVCWKDTQGNEYAPGSEMPITQANVMLTAIYGGPFYVVSKDTDYPTLQEAVDAADTTDTILIHPCSDFGVTEYGASYATNDTSKIGQYGGEVYITGKSLTIKSENGKDTAPLKDFEIIFVGCASANSYTIDDVKFTGQSMLDFDNQSDGESGGARPFGDITVQNCSANVSTTTKRSVNGHYLGNYSGNSFIVFPQQGGGTTQSLTVTGNTIITNNADRCIYGGARPMSVQIYNNTFGSPSGRYTDTAVVFERFPAGITSNIEIYNNVCYTGTTNCGIFYLNSDNAASVNITVHDNEVFGSGYVDMENRIRILTNDNKLKPVGTIAAGIGSGKTVTYHNYVNGYCDNEVNKNSSGVVYDTQCGHTYDEHIKDVPGGSTKVEDVYQGGKAEAFDGTTHSNPIVELGSTRYCDRCDELEFPEVELPETGGIGATTIYVIGALLMFGALTIGHILWRRREGRGDV